MNTEYLRLEGEGERNTINHLPKYTESKGTITQ